ncbi:MAG: hypothetical protein WCQ60_03975 [bacterium]
MFVSNTCKPTHYGAYKSTTKGKTFVCCEFSNSQDGAPGLTNLQIKGRMPDNNFIYNAKTPYLCIVTKGSGDILYFYDNKVESYHIEQGNNIYIPPNTVYAFKGEDLELSLVGTPQWTLATSRVVEID